LHLDGRDVSRLPLIERKALLEPLVADQPGIQFNGHETGDGASRNLRKFGASDLDDPVAPPAQDRFRQRAFL
jgi:hypothetical protein